MFRFLFVVEILCDCYFGNRMNDTFVSALSALCGEFCFKNSNIDRIYEIRITHEMCDTVTGGTFISRQLSFHFYRNWVNNCGVNIWMKLNWLTLVLQFLACISLGFDVFYCCHATWTCNQSWFSETEKRTTPIIRIGRSELSERAFCCFPFDFQFVQKNILTPN